MLIKLRDKAKVGKLKTDDNGFLIINDVVVARSGIQKYLGVEIGDTDIFGEVNVFRHKEEVTSQKTIESFKNLIVTDDHPNDFVSPENSHILSKGFSSNPKIFEQNDEAYIKMDFIITSKELIQKIIDGKREISVGYTANIIKENGFFKNEEYQYAQKDIIANHNAIVNKARCGSMCKINDTLDKIGNISIKRKIMKIKIGDTDFEIDEAVGNHIASLEKKIKQLNDSFDGFKTAQNATMEAEIENRLEAINIAKKIGIDKVTFKDSAISIKSKVLTAKGFNVNDKSEDYINGSFDSLRIDLIDSQNNKQESKKMVDSWEAKILEINKLEVK